MNGIATITIHAPLRELRDRDHDEHDAGRDGADAVDHGAALPPVLPRAAPTAAPCPACDRVNAVNTPTT